MTKQKRQTQQKSVLEKVFREAMRPLSHTEIIACAKQLGIEPSRVTVFRFLRSQAELGNIRRIRSARGETLFGWGQEASSNQSHFFCKECEVTFPLKSEELEVRGLDLPEGFVAQGQEVQIVGTCKNCSE